MLKKILYVVSGLLVLAVLAVGYIWIPSHWTIRSVKPDIPPLEDLLAYIESATISPSDYPEDVNYILSAAKDVDGRKVAYAAINIRWPDGKRFIIDAGMDPAEVVAFVASLGGDTSSNSLHIVGSVEDQLGSEINSVAGIGFTHLHSDHTRGVTDICSTMDNPATIYQTFNQATIGILRTEEGRRLVAKSKCPKQQLGNENIKNVPGFPGVFALDAGGHTPGSTLYVVRQQNKTWIFSGDLTSTKSAIVQNEPKPWFYRYIIVPENETVLTAWRAWLSDAIRVDSVEVVVSHDLSSYQDAGLRQWSLVNQGQNSG